MQIIYNIDEFFISVFPELKGKTNEELVTYLKDYFTNGNDIPIIKLDGNIIIIEMDSPVVDAKTKEYKQALVSIPDFS